MCAIVSNEIRVCVLRSSCMKFEVLYRTIKVDIWYNIFRVIFSIKNQKYSFGIYDGIKCNVLQMRPRERVMSVDVAFRCIELKNV